VNHRPGKYHWRNRSQITETVIGNTNPNAHKLSNFFTLWLLEGLEPCPYQKRQSDGETSFYNFYIQKELENQSIRSYRILYNLPSNSRHISPKLKSDRISSDIV